MAAGRPAIAGVVCYYEVNGRLAFEYGLQLWTVGKIACLSVASYVNRTYVHMVAARMQCGAITKEKKADGDVAGVGWWPSTEASIESILVTN